MPDHPFTTRVVKTFGYSSRLYLSLDFTQKTNICFMSGVNTVFSFQHWLNWERKKQLTAFELEHKLHIDQSECHIVY